MLGIIMMKSIVCVVVLCAVASAQRPARDVALLGGPVEASITDVGLLTIVTGSAGAVQTGVTAPGGLLGLGTDEVLVAGRAANGHGLIEHWKPVLGSYQLQSAFNLPGADFAGIAYDPTGGQLYVLNCAANAILRATWDGGSALPATWSVWVTSVEVTDLQAAQEHHLKLLPADDTSPARVYMGPWPELYEGEAIVLSGEPGSVIATQFSWLDLSKVAQIRADQRTVSEAGTTIAVGAPSGTSVEVVHLGSGSVIGSGTVPPGQNSVLVGASTGFLIGEKYVARKFGDPSFSYQGLFCMRRYGFPESYSDGAQLERITNPEDFWVGNADFMLVGGVTKTPAPTSDIALTGYLGIAVRSSQGTDPVVPYGSNMLLVTDVFVAAHGRIASSGQGLIHGEVPIPNDPSLEGAVVLFQYWMIDGPGIRLGEVVGIKIAPRPPDEVLPGAGDGSGLLQGTGGRGFSPATAVREWLSWLVQTGRAQRSSGPLELILKQPHH